MISKSLVFVLLCSLLSTSKVLAAGKGDVVNDAAQFFSRLATHTKRSRQVINDDLRAYNVMEDGVQLNTDGLADVEVKTIYGMQTKPAETIENLDIDYVLESPAISLFYLKYLDLNNLQVKEALSRLLNQAASINVNYPERYPIINFYYKYIQLIKQSTFVSMENKMNKLADIFAAMISNMHSKHISSVLSNIVRSSDGLSLEDFPSTETLLNRVVKSDHFSLSSKAFQIMPMLRAKDMSGNSEFYLRWFMGMQKVGRDANEMISELVETRVCNSLRCGNLTELTAEGDSLIQALVEGASTDDEFAEMLLEVIDETGLRRFFENTP